MIDPIINFFDGEENSNTEIRKLLDRIDKLIELNNCAVILAHHTGKERADDKSFMSARVGQSSQDGSTQASRCQARNPTCPSSMKQGTHEILMNT